MTMKTIELSAEAAVSPERAVKLPYVATPGIRLLASRWLTAVRGALSRYVAHNEKAWDRMVDAQARDPNRF